MRKGITLYKVKYIDYVFYVKTAKEIANVFRCFEFSDNSKGVQSVNGYAILLSAT